MKPDPQGKHPARQSRLPRRAAMVLACGLCLTAAIAIWALVTGSFDETDARVLASTFAASVCTLAGLVGATVLDRRDFRRPLGQATIGLAAVDLALALALIWQSDPGESSVLWRAVGVTSALLPALAHACLVLGRRRRRESSTVTALSWGAVGFAAPAALLVSGLFAFATGPIDPAVWKLLGVLVVLAVLATLLVPIARRIADGQGPTATRDAERTDRPADGAPSHARRSPRFHWRAAAG